MKADQLMTRVQAENRQKASDTASWWTYETCCFALLRDCLRQSDADLLRPTDTDFLLAWSEVGRRAEDLQQWCGDGSGTEEQMVY